VALDPYLSFGADDRCGVDKRRHKTICRHFLARQAEKYYGKQAR
jgi:hypothetical protein